MTSPEQDVSLEFMLMQQSTARLQRIHELEAEVAALKERLEASERDAARWQYVRNLDAVDGSAFAEKYMATDPDEIDAIVDAALARGGV